MQAVVPAREDAGTDELLGLREALEALPATQRKAILLREWQGLSYREIGEELELSQSAVETLIFRARRSLAQGLEQDPSAATRRALVARARQGLDAGSLLLAPKALLAGATAVKATTAAVAVSAVVVFAADRPVRAVAQTSPPCGRRSASARRRLRQTPARPWRRRAR